MGIVGVVGSLPFPSRCHWRTTVAPKKNRAVNNKNTRTVISNSMQYNTVQSGQTVLKLSIPLSTKCLITLRTFLTMTAIMP